MRRPNLPLAPPSPEIGAQATIVELLLKPVLLRVLQNVPLPPISLPNEVPGLIKNAVPTNIPQYIIENIQEDLKTRDDIIRLLQQDPLLKALSTLPAIGKTTTELFTAYTNDKLEDYADEPATREQSTSKLIGASTEDQQAEINDTQNYHNTKKVIKEFIEKLKDNTNIGMNLITESLEKLNNNVMAFRGIGLRHPLFAAYASLIQKGIRELVIPFLRKQPETDNSEALYEYLVWHFFNPKETQCKEGDKNFKGYALSNDDKTKILAAMQILNPGLDTDLYLKDINNTCAKIETVVGGIIASILNSQYQTEKAIIGQALDFDRNIETQLNNRKIKKQVEAFEKNEAERKKEIKETPLEPPPEIEELTLDEFPSYKDLLQSPITDENMGSYKEKLSGACRAAINIQIFEMAIAQLTEGRTIKKEDLKKLSDDFLQIQEKFDKDLISNEQSADNKQREIVSARESIRELSEKVSRNQLATEEYNEAYWLARILMTRPLDAMEIYDLENKIEENEETVEKLEKTLAVIKERIKNNQNNHEQKKQNFLKELNLLGEQIESIEEKIKKYTEVQDYLKKVQEITDRVDREAAQAPEAVLPPVEDASYAVKLRDEITLFNNKIRQVIEQDQIAHQDKTDLIDLLNRIYNAAEKINSVSENISKEEIEKLEETIDLYKEKSRLLKIQLQLIPEEEKTRVQEQINTADQEIAPSITILQAKKAEMQRLEGINPVKSIAQDIIKNKSEYESDIDSGELEKYKKIYATFTKYEKELDEYIKERKIYLDNLQGNPQNNWLVRLWYGFLALAWVNQDVISAKIDAATTTKEKLVQSKNNICTLFLLDSEKLNLKERRVEQVNINEITQATEASLKQFKQEFFKPTSKYRTILKSVQKDLKDIQDSHKPIQR